MSDRLPMVRDTQSTSLSRRERGTVERHRQAIKRDVQIQAAKVDGAVALAGYSMEQVIKLDNHRAALAQEDPNRNLLLSEIEATALNQVKRIQAGLYDDAWGL